MAQEVATIKIFPEEQIQTEGIANIGVNTAPKWGVARVGDKMPTNYRTNITPANKIPNRIPRIPCQFVAIAFDNAGGQKVNGGDVKDGLLYNGATLPNGNTVELSWSAAMKNGKWNGSGTPSTSWGDGRNPKNFIAETAIANASPTTLLGFTIDDTGLLIPGNDGILKFLVAGPSPSEPEAVKSSDFGFSNNFDTDRTCDGFVKVDYAEIKPDNTKTNNLPQVQIKAVIAQPDWAVTKKTPKGWNLP